MSQQNHSSRQNLWTPDEASQKLSEIKLSIEIINRSLAAGESIRDATSSLYPTIYGGLSAWAEKVKHLAEGHIPLGWRKKESRNFPYIVDEHGKTMLWVVGGDEYTGVRKGNPTNTRSRGIITFEAVQVNCGQVMLPGLIAEENSETQSNGPASYVLLNFRSGDTIYAEVSRPAKMNKGFIEGWNERILLPPIDLTKINFPLDEEPDEDIDIDILPIG